MSTLTINIAEHLGETMDFDCIDHGAYLLLLFHYRMTERPLRDTPESMSRITRMSPTDWARIRPRLIRMFSIDEQTGDWRHPELDAAIAKARKTRFHAVKASKAAAEKRGEVPPTQHTLKEMRDYLDQARNQAPPAPERPTVVLPPPEVPPPADEDDAIGSPLDPMMELTGAEVKACMEDLPGVSADEIAQVFDSFKRYHLAAGSFSTDWLASWWKWWERKKPAKPKVKPRIEVSRKAQPATGDE